MKKQLLILLSNIGLFSSCAPSKTDKYNSLNDFLDTKIKDESEKIIIIKKKENLDKVIKIFRGDFLEFADSYGLVRLEKPIKEGGIDFPLYDERNWRKMKKRYGSTKGNSTFNFGYWNENDFKHKKVEFVNRIEFWKKIKSIYLSFQYYKRDKSIKKIYAFSTPILYKKDYLTFLVFEGNNDFSPMSNGDDYVVVMKKITGKWVVIQKGYDNIHH